MIEKEEGRPVCFIRQNQPKNSLGVLWRPRHERNLKFWISSGVLILDINLWGELDVPHVQSFCAIIIPPQLSLQKQPGATHTR